MNIYQPSEGKACLKEEEKGGEKKQKKTRQNVNKFDLKLFSYEIAVNTWYYGHRWD